MRLSLVTATPATTRSGSGTFVATEKLAESLRNLGHEIRIVRPPAASPPLGALVRRLVFNLTLDRTTIERGSDAVVGFDMDGFRLAGRGTKPFVAYLHGVIGDEARFESGLVAVSLSLQARAERKAARRADLVIATSAYSRQRIADLYAVPLDRIAVVQPGIDLATWDELLTRAPLRPHQQPTVLSVAHMYPRKNLEALIRATAILRRELDLRVRIVGIGPERKKLESLARQEGLHQVISLLGHVDLNTLAAEYRACDVFCLPSLQEGFGLVYLEAMAARKPVVALAASSTPEIIRDGANGRLAPAGDDAALASCLLDLLRDPAKRERMGQAGRACAEEFTADRMARRFAEVVGALILPSSLTISS